MRNAACTIAFLLVLAAALPAAAVPQAPQLEPPTRPAQAAGLSVAAAATNLVYFPARLTLTLLTAELGGLTGCMTGGDARSARAVWDLTQGQSFITPRVLEGQEALRFGPWPSNSR
jgi:hypothetical protein